MPTETDIGKITVRITNGKGGRPSIGDKRGVTLTCYIKPETAELIYAWQRKAGRIIPKMTVGKTIDLLAGCSVLNFEKHLTKAAKLAAGKAIK
jgi:hypothetical protein